MYAALQALRRELSFELEVRDVDSDPELERRYGELVPVLALDGQTVCQYRLDPAKLRARLAEIS